MITLAGVNVTVEPDDMLSAAERLLLRRLKVMSRSAKLPAAPLLASVRLRLADREQTSAGTGGSLDGARAARIDCSEGAVKIHHECFDVFIDPSTGDALVRRETDDAYPLEIAIRTAVCCALPRAGGLPLHAAAVIIDGWAVVFFGCSGAGKSTIAAASPYPVLSDELVAVRGPNWIAEATGFWGEMGTQDANPTCFGAPLKALVELQKGPACHIDTIPPDKASRRLLHVVKVPTIPLLWRDVLLQTARLARDVPVYRMQWHRDDPPWRDLRHRLGISDTAARPNQGAAWPSSNAWEVPSATIP